MARDFIDEIMAERTARNPNFPKMVEEAMARQDAAHAQTPPNIPGPCHSSHLEWHLSKLRDDTRKLAGQAKDLADRRKHKTPA